MKKWYPLILVSIATKFGGCSFLESCTKKFLNTTWLSDSIGIKKLVLKNETVITKSDRKQLYKSYYKVRQYLFILEIWT